MHNLNFNDALEYLITHPKEVEISPSPEFFERSDVRGAIFQALNDAQISFPYPANIIENYELEQKPRIDLVARTQNDNLPAFRDLVTLQLATYRYALSLGSQV